MRNCIYSKLVVRGPRIYVRGPGRPYSINFHQSALQVSLPQAVFAVPIARRSERERGVKSLRQAKRIERGVKRRSLFSTVSFFLLVPIPPFLSSLSLSPTPLLIFTFARGRPPTLSLLPFSPSSLALLSSSSGTCTKVALLAPFIRVTCSNEAGIITLLFNFILIS